MLSTSNWARAADALVPLSYNNPGLVVDLGVGLWAWPLPMDFDGDGDLDLVVSCPDKPSNGTYFFESPGGAKMPVFKPGVRIGKGYNNIRVTHVDGRPRVLVPGAEFESITTKRLDARRKLDVPDAEFAGRNIRANQWHYVDFDGDGRLDVLIGVGDWTDYGSFAVGWEGAFDDRGRWKLGPLRGQLYLARNVGTNDAPRYEALRRIPLGEGASNDGKPLEVYGCPSPCVADFDGDGDLDIICGEFLDQFSYFENVGTRRQPKYAAGERLVHDGKPIAMDLQMIVPTPIDWDADGDVDLIVGDEDGRVALVENTGRIAGRVPGFLPPVYFRQQADRLKCGALATPVGFDWDGDGDEDIVSGNTAGYIEFFENLGPGEDDKLPRWAAPRRLSADGETIRIQAGENGSVQGPCEAKWGYTTLSVADWNVDGLPDLVVNSIWGKVVWYENVGTRKAARLRASQPIEVQWPGDPPRPAWNWWSPQGKELVTQWRTTPAVVDFNGDKLPDLVMLDHEGYLALFRRQRAASEGGKSRLTLLPGERIFVDESGEPLQLNDGRAGRSGRRKLHVVDWDNDGRLDVLTNGINADFYRNLGAPDGKTVLKNTGPLSPRQLSSHTTSPATVDWDGDGRRDLIVGAEDGVIYFMQNSTIESK
ncbi:MAG: VCBS repeat-containing protein [Pirellulales bacterium]